MTTYSLKKEQNKEDLTVYNIYLGHVLLHTEYSASSANDVKARLGAGETLYDILHGQFHRMTKMASHQVDTLQREVDKLSLYRDGAIMELAESAIMLEKSNELVVKARLDVQSLTAQVNTPKPAVQAIKPPTRRPVRANNSLDLDEAAELVNYCTLFVTQGFKQHWDVNAYLDKTDQWNHFPIIRSRNTHQNGYTVNGIHKRCYAIVCQILSLEGDGGSPLQMVEDY
jgi:hypothetical protein